MNDPRTYRAPVRRQSSRVTESPPPPYADVTTETPAPDLVTDRHQQTSVEYNKSLCRILKELWNRLRNHKTSMILAPIFFLLSAVWFAALVIGGEKRWECPNNPKIATWLIINGVMGIVFSWLMAFLVRLFTNFVSSISEK
ncbi:unnamed protein product [Adineta steineri]|uniref:Uncharacterized protein n=1 Tax=Adineta steineri TaxID=433720 RepID=A0A813MT04_9BILA|nr:unnamed protein product [Adineta steineri]CAF4009143.1 unnamed protein product [Adineta steineri]